MDMLGRRSSYSLLSQYADEPPPPPQFETPASEKSRGKFLFDLPIGSDAAASGDQRGAVRIGGFFPSIGLQTQSSGSSFGESSLSGDYYIPTTISSATATIGPEGFYPASGGGVEGKGKDGAEAIGSSSSSKSWAQQAEETYQLQLALALRLCSETSCASDSNLLDPDDQFVPAERASAESMSHRFWVNGWLTYNDKVPDGFYMIRGMDPFVWTLCTDVKEESRIPSIESLKIIQLSESSIEVILIDKYYDSELRQLTNLAVGLSSSCANTKEIVEQLAKLVCTQMGGAASGEEYGLLPRWKECSEALKNSALSVVISIGKLSVGLCRHRALLFKILADAVHLPCRIAKGCKFCKCDDSSSCLVRFGLEREYLVDLIGSPGFLCEPNSLLNGPNSIAILSPLRPPKCKPVKIAENFRSLAKQYFMDCQSLNLMFSDTSTENIAGQENGTDSSMPRYYDEKYADASSYLPATIDETVLLEVPQHHVLRDALRDGPQGDTQLQKWNNHIEIAYASEYEALGKAQVKHVPRDGQMDILPVLPFHDTKANITDDLTIPWSDLALKERIGAGSFGTVHRAEWHGSEVAVKILMEQDFLAERFKEFLREVSIMKSLRHPNIVLFMGAVTQPPHLSIVTEYLSRGSLYRFLHKQGAKETLDERHRLNMAFDVAKGMNYLHNRNPPIVHRDLKSPNLLVDRKYTVKVCDFGLSRLKASTYLSSKSLAGTPEWMAPEVLRDEPSNEKSDVYSFGVILWELMTLQQPWCNLNPAQVVAAVGFKGRRLEIPSNTKPEVAAIIESCWARYRERINWISIIFFLYSANLNLIIVKNLNLSFFVFFFEFK
ncbi:Serine/threonine-protein kinase CTR1 [Apostasia shenzhenica]|uniref:non-specific serine/threonine protein kinase n=1 Tax=Apostasia shenzhenica TaxID=1088818 RepID=A0A2I0ANU7_9ASPA|nr:Serine/threonine-protein kinase CTR1 [Apostasia shenzhenica]